MCTKVGATSTSILLNKSENSSKRLDFSNFLTKGKQGMCPGPNACPYSVLLASQHF